MKIAAVIPCLNEENSIVQTIEGIRKVTPGLDIWVVDNGSTDQTVKMAESTGVFVLREPQQGKGFALRRGFTSIPDGYGAYFMVDGDDTYGVTELTRAIKLIEIDGYDVVIGRREAPALPPTDRKIEYRFGHSLGNKFLTSVFTKLFGIQISDTLSGWRLMSSGYVKSFSGGNSGFEIEAELNAHCYTINAAVTEIPVSYTGRLIDSHSKLNTYKDGFLILRRNLRLYRSERPLLAYTLLSIPWFLISGILVIPILLTYQETQLVPRFPSLIVAVGTFIVACNLWIAGMILEKTRQIRTAMARELYSRYSRSFGNS